MKARHSLGALAQGLILVATTVKATISYNSQCGIPSKFTCVGSPYGDCCAANGFCGSTEKHCGDGCQSEYGFCNGKQQAELKIRGYGRCQHGWTPTGAFDGLNGLPTTAAAADFGAHAEKPSVTATISAEETLTAPPDPVFTDAPTEATEIEPTDFSEQTGGPTLSGLTPSLAPTTTAAASPGDSTSQSICEGLTDDRQCVDNFLIGCDQAIPVVSVRFCDPNIVPTDDDSCQALCLGDEDCTGWQTSLSGGDEGGPPDFNCCLYHDALVLNATATPQQETGFDWGIRNACSSAYGVSSFGVGRLPGGPLLV